MRRSVCIGWCLFASALVAAAAAGDVAGVAPVATERGPVQAPSAELVLKHVPADAFATVYMRDLNGALSGSLVRLAEALDEELAPVFEWLRGTTDGPVLLAIGGMPPNPFSWRITLIAGTTADRATFVDGMERTVMPLWNRRLKNEIGAMQVTRSPSGDRIMLLGRLTTSFELGFRDGYVIATSVPGAAAKWDPVNGSSDDFVLRPEWKDLTSGLAALPDFAAVVDLRAIMPALAATLDAQVPNLGRSLQVGLPATVGFSVGTILAKDPPSEPAPAGTPEQEGSTKSASATPVTGIAPQRACAARLSVVVDRSRPGPWRFFAGAASPPSIAAAFPADTTFFVRGGMTSLADQWENVAAVLGGIDDEIAKEASEDAQAFAAEHGFHPYREFLANFVDEWAIGGRVHDEGLHDVVVAFRLEDGAQFERHLDVLRKHFDLRSSRTQHRGTTIETAERAYGPFSFAVQDDVLFVSSDSRAVARGLDALMNGSALDKQGLFQRATAPLGDVSWLVYLDGTSFLKEVEDKAEGTPFAGVLRGALADPGLALGVRPTEHGLQAEIAVRAATGVAGTTSLVASLTQAREQARRVRAMSAMRGLLVGCVIHASDRKGAWPVSLDELVASGVIGEPTEARGLLADPYSDGAPKQQRPYYLYRAPADVAKVADPASYVVLSEPTLRDGGANFGFLDGHVEYITGDRAESLLAQMRGM